MNRDPVIFDEPHGYYGPAVIHHGDRTFDVTAELHIRPEEHGRLSWSGTLTARTTDASTALYQLRREQFTLDVADRTAQCAGTEVRLISNEPMQLRIVGIGPGPFRRTVDLADLNRLARERREGKHGDAHLRVHPGVWELLRDQLPPATPDQFNRQWLTALVIVMDDDLPPGTWQLTAADGEVREEGRVEP